LPPDRRRIIIDEDMGPALARQLRGRGRSDAMSVKTSVLEGFKDVPLFRAIASCYEPAVLVTWDNRMPWVHRADLERHQITLAVIDRKGLARAGTSEKHYWQDVVHRWLHTIEAQEPATVRLYSQAGSRPPRRAP
jgi:hypothetical protein